MALTIEENKAVLISLLDFLLQETNNVADKDNRKRFHMKYNEPLMRNKLLDDFAYT